MTRRLLAACAVALLVTAPACSKKDDDDAARTPGATATTSPTNPPTLTWTVQGHEANGTQPPSDDIIASVKATLDAYLAQAIVAPLYTGTPAGDLSTIFTPVALERVVGDPTARATLIDEGMPAATDAIVAEAANVTLGSVAGPDGVTAIIGAQVDLTVHATGPAIDVRIVRNGEMTLIPEGDGWRIDSFIVRAQRDTTP
jgi:hypothetical protein